jgi:uncharacterized protein YndB with AHSA1/START domain
MKMKVQRSINIAAPPEKVWPLVAEPEAILKWYMPLQKFEYTSEQRNEVGAPIHFEEKVGGRLLKLDCVVTEWAENEAFAFKMTTGDMKSYQERWSLESTSSGSRFTFQEQGELPYGIVGKIVDPLAERGSAATVEKMLQKLKSLAEAN